MQNESMRMMVRGAYDVQKLRIQMGNRVCAQFRAKLGQAPGTPEEEIDDAEAKELLASLKAEYNRITDGIVRRRKKPLRFDGMALISTPVEAMLVEEYIAFEALESMQFKHMEKALESHRIWTEWMHGVRGVGPAMAGVIISEIDIYKARYVSSLWAYAGFDVASDGQGRSRKKEHLVEREYTNREGKQDTRNSITFNPFLKTKLYVLATSFVKAGNSPYRKAYDDYKHRLESDPNHAEKTKGHRHNMAMRYCIKRFLADLYVQWRTLEGLPVAPDYHEAKMGHVHAA